jgi:hypothetical protein
MSLLFLKTTRAIGRFTWVMPMESHILTGIWLYGTELALWCSSKV